MNQTTARGAKFERDERRRGDCRRARSASRSCGWMGQALDVAQRSGWERRRFCWRLVGLDWTSI